mgnify:CR=1 FL=1
MKLDQSHQGEAAVERIMKRCFGSHSNKQEDIFLNRLFLFKFPSNDKGVEKEREKEGYIIHIE